MRGGVGVVEAALVQVAQGVEIRRRHQGVVDGVKRLRGVHPSEPATVSEAQCPACAGVGDGPHVVGVDRVGGRLHPLPQAAGDPLLDGQEGHHVEQVGRSPGSAGDPRS